MCGKIALGSAMATIDKARFASVAVQMMTGSTVELEGQRLPVRRIGHKRLRSVWFTADGREYQAIEQNPEKTSRWGLLAREHRMVVQFEDIAQKEFVAVAVDGKVTEYGELRRRKGESS